jgi:hypothetical protein
MQNNTPHFSAWLDNFFTTYYIRRPVNATFIGEHDYDHLLPDYSDDAVTDTLAEMQILLGQLCALPVEPLTSAQKMDSKLAAGYLHTQMWEFESKHFHRGNPCTYTNEAIFGVISLFLTNYASLDQIVNAAVQRMQAVPRLLQQGEDQVRSAPIAWTDKAIDECTGALHFFTDGIERLIESLNITDPHFRQSADLAADAFRRFQSYLQETLRFASEKTSLACGEEAFLLMMRQGHFIDPNLSEMVQYAEDELSKASDYLETHAIDFGASSSAAALALLSDDHPAADSYYNRFCQVWNDCHATALKCELVSWPDFPIEYVPIPEWARQAAPYLYFLPYRAPAAFNRPPVHKYLVPVLDYSLPEAQQEKMLRAVNNSVIKLNHVIHHGSIGHHVQNWNAYRAQSRIGQMAACDCASRLAMFCSGTTAEGWAVYATMLMDEFDFLTPLESYAEYQSRRRMCARTVVDIKLHCGEFTLEDAVQYYQTRAAMGPDMAHKEAVKNSMFPGAAMMYLYGSDRIVRLREELSSRLGPDFNLRTFHDRFLSFGPVELIAQEMLKELEHVE